MTDRRTAKAVRALAIGLLLLAALVIVRRASAHGPKVQPDKGVVVLQAADRPLVGAACTDANEAAHYQVEGEQGFYYCTPGGVFAFSEVLDFSSDDTADARIYGMTPTDTVSPTGTPNTRVLTIKSESGIIFLAGAAYTFTPPSRPGGDITRGPETWVFIDTDADDDAALDLISRLSYGHGWTEDWTGAETLWRPHEEYIRLSHETTYDALEITYDDGGSSGIHDSQKGFYIGEGWTELPAGSLSGVCAADQGRLSYDQTADTFRLCDDGEIKALVQETADSEWIAPESMFADEVDGGNANQCTINTDVQLGVSGTRSAYIDCTIADDDNDDTVDDAAFFSFPMKMPDSYADSSPEQVWLDVPIFFENASPAGTLVMKAVVLCSDDGEPAPLMSNHRTGTACNFDATGYSNDDIGLFRCGPVTPTAVNAGAFCNLRLSSQYSTDSQPTDKWILGVRIVYDIHADEHP